VKKQVQLTSQAFKPTWQLFLCMEKVFIWAISKLEDFIQDYLFLEK
jgi:hypothetical protein